MSSSSAAENPGHSLEGDAGLHRLDLALVATAIIVTIAGLAAFYSDNGFDSGRFINGDTLYPIHTFLYPALEYRVPPSNNYFPDLLVHLALKPLVADVLTEKLIGGIALFVLVAVTALLTRGVFAFAAVICVYGAFGFYFFDSTAHFSLPFLFALVLLPLPMMARLAVLAIGVFSEPLLLIPFAFVAWTLEPRERNAALAVGAVMLVLATIHSEFSVELSKFYVAIVPFYISVAIARRMGLEKAYAAVLILFFLELAAVDMLPTRYSVPVSTSLLFCLLPVRRLPGTIFGRAFAAAAPLAAIVAIFLLTLDRSAYASQEADLDCMLGALHNRGIETVAVDHWTAKPLDVAAHRSGRPITITQTDFEDEDVHMWLAPLAFFGKPTPYALRNAEVCLRESGNPKYCNQDHLGKARIVSTEPLCGRFTLYRYDRTVPENYGPRPDGKLQSAALHLVEYLDKVLGTARARLRSAVALKTEAEQ